MCIYTYSIWPCVIIRHYYTPRRRRPKIDDETVRREYSSSVRPFSKNTIVLSSSRYEITVVVL